MWGDVAFSLTLLIFGILAGIALVSKALRSAPNITVDIWVMRGDNTISALANNTFHVWSEQEINSIDWNNGLFR